MAGYLISTLTLLLLAICFFGQVIGFTHNMLRERDKGISSDRKNTSLFYEQEKDLQAQNNYQSTRTKWPVRNSTDSYDGSTFATNLNGGNKAKSWRLNADETSQSTGWFMAAPCWYNSTYTNCSFRGLQRVPTYNFSKTMIVFDLHNNSITELHDFAFIRYSQLQILNLMCNKIAKLSNFAFSGLGKLNFLDLWNNKLVMYINAFPIDVFLPLRSLKMLRINRNTEKVNEASLVYPDEALSRLKSLEVLHMDGLQNKDFGPGFQNMTALTDLSLAGYYQGHCKLRSLRNTTFEYLSQLQYLDLNDCFILGKNIQAGTFSPLTKLVSLKLTHNEDIDIPYLDSVFYGLYNTTTLKYLSMHLIVNRYSVGICLEHTLIKYFPQHLEYFDAQENNIEGVDRYVIKKLSPSLKKLDVSSNKFVFGTYLQDLQFMTNLTHLRLNGGSFTYKLPSIYPYQMTRNGPPSHNCTLYGKYEEDKLHEPFILRLPPKLRKIEMNDAGLTYVLSKLIVDEKNSLEYLSMVGNRFPRLIGPFLGLHSLKHLNLSSSFVRVISREFFLNLNSLISLNLSSNLLGDFLRENSELDIFPTLTNLTILDLSFNDITRLPKGIFDPLVNLKILYFQKNPLRKLNVNISRMLSLQYLNFRSTRLTFLPVNFRESIDSLIKRSIPVKIDMSESPVYCDCMNIEFLKWMTSSKAFDREFKKYDCVYPDSSTKTIKDGYNSTLVDLNRQCSTHIVMRFVVGVVTAAVGIFILAAILYRFRWKLKYLYYAAYVHYRKRGGNQELEFQYDAFICYAIEDEDFVLTKLSPELEKRGLRLCIHGRDFRAGEYIGSNIVKAVCESRKTIVVVTRYLTGSKWCSYEIQMANMEAVHTGRRVLIFLIRENTPELDLGRELLYNIKNNTYISFEDPLPDATSIGRMWDKLVIDVRDE